MLGWTLATNGIELYRTNSKRAASLVSTRSRALDITAEAIKNDAKAAAEPYRKSATDSYVDHFKVKRSLYKGPQQYPNIPVWDRVVYNDDPAAHIIELGIAANELHFRDGRTQDVTHFQRGHFFLVGAAAKAVALASLTRPQPSAQKSNWDSRRANAAIDRSGSQGTRHGGY